MSFEREHLDHAEEWDAYAEKAQARGDLREASRCRRRAVTARSDAAFVRDARIILFYLLFIILAVIVFWEVFH